MCSATDFNIIRGKRAMKGKKSEFMANVLSNPRYRGKHIVVIAGKVFAADTGRQAARIFNEVTKKYSGQIPTLAYIPKEESLILIWRES